MASRGLQRHTDAIALGGMLLAALVPRAAAAPPVNLPPPATEIARQIYDLHTLILWICLGIFVVVFLPMIWAIARHRKSRGHVAHDFHEHPGLEITWTVIPVLILVAMAWPATQTVLAMKDTEAADLTIKVTGYQWKWEYEYLGDGLRYFSNLSTPTEQREGGAPKSPHYLLEADRPLVVPAGQKVRLLLTAADVIHAWWVPELGVKQDAIPGFVRDTWFRVDRPGIYRGQCAELCGTGHGYMPVVVEALPPAQYAAWREAQLGAQAAARAEAAASAGKTYAAGELIALGETVYKTHCAACHGLDGKGVAGAFPPLSGAPMVQGPVGPHLARVFAGKPGTAMAAYAPILTDLELAAVVTFERNSWQNRTGDVVQPADVAALRTR